MSDELTVLATTTAAAIAGRTPVRVVDFCPGNGTRYLLVFSLLALSSIPVLRAIGTTVTLGVVFNFALALLVSRQPARSPAGTTR